MSHMPQGQPNEEGIAKLGDDEEAQRGAEDVALGDFEEDRPL